MRRNTSTFNTGASLVDFRLQTGRGKTLARLCAAALAAALFGCGSSGPASIRLVDEFQSELVEGAPTRIERTAPTVHWSFGEADEEPSKEAPQTRGWKAGTGVAGLTLRDGTLRGRSTTDFPIIHVQPDEADRSDDALHSIEIRLRADKGANLNINALPEQELDFSQIVAEAKGFPWPMATPIIAGEEFQTLTLTPTMPLRMSAIHHLLIRPVDEPGARFEIESVRLISQGEYLSRIPSGVGWRGLADIYRETLVSRAPETVRFQIELPGDPWLDLNVGTVEPGAVTFAVAISAGGPESMLLERTVTTPQRWESAPIELAAYAGQTVTLSFSLPGAPDGTIGFWGGPTVRNRAGVSPAATKRPSVELAAGSEAPQGVILIMADTLRKDHLNFYGYERETAPVLSRMAAAGAVFRDNVSQATWTKVSTPSIMTSLYPSSHGVKDFTDRLPAAATTLAEVYREAGYATVAYSSVLFTGKFTNLHQGYEELHESTSVESDRRSKTARTYVDRLTRWIEEHREEPFFAYLHVFDPHDPFEPDSPYNARWADLAMKEAHEGDLEKVRKVIKDPLMKRFGMPSRDELAEAGLDPQEYVDYDIDWYDGSILGMDAEIGRLIERLRSLGLAEKTLIAFVADHGEEFIEHGRMFHGQTVYGELTGVPLLFYRPGVVPAGVVVDRTVRSIDLMPTLLELSHLPAPEGMQGQSLVPLMASPNGDGWTERAAVSEKALTEQAGGPPPRDTESYAVVSGGWKLIHNVHPEQGKPDFELFDHSKDPLDLNDVAAERQDIVEKLRAELDQWREMVDAARLPDADSTEGISSEELERLRSLGYIR